MNIPDYDILAEHGMDFPHRRIDDRQALDQNILAFVRLDELRSQIVAETEHTFGDRHVLVHHLVQMRTRGPLAEDLRIAAVVRIAVPFPEERFALSVERALAGDRDVR